MPTQLNFDEEMRYPDDPSGITVPVLLTYGEKSLRVAAKVDTGAQVCLFAHEVGLRLGLAIEQGTPIVLSRCQDRTGISTLTPDWYNVAVGRIWISR